MKKTLLLALLALAPLALHATPTRLITTDNMNQILPDDWDATTYYSLSPNFKNHWYMDAYPTGKSLGWAFVDIGIGTLVVWYNKPFEGGALYDASVAFTGIGLSNTAFATDVVNAWEPREKRIKTPDNKIALGYALPVTDSLNLGLCFRLAELNLTKDAQNQDGNGGSGAIFGASSGYQTTLGSAAYNGLNVIKYANTETSNGLVISPQFSYAGDSFSLDFKFDMVWSNIDNKHSEDLINGANSGTVTQSLKDKGRMSWYARPKLRYMLDNSSSLVLRVSYGQLDLSNEHRVKGSFSGAGFSAQELAGYDLMDSSQDLGITQADATLGLLKTWNKGREMVLWGLVPSYQLAHVVSTTYQGKAAATTYSDVVKLSLNDVSETTWQLPLVMGTELGVAPWCKVRGVIQRNLFSSDAVKTAKDGFNSSEVQTSHNTTSTSSDFATGWVFNTGWGLSFGQFGWDTAINTTFLGSTAAFSNPLYQSSFTYEF